MEEEYWEKKQVQTQREQVNNWRPTVLKAEGKKDKMEKRRGKERRRKKNALGIAKTHLGSRQ